jgi:hypothetical protein
MTIVLATLSVIAFAPSADAAQKKPKKSCREFCLQRSGGRTTTPGYQMCMDSCNKRH